MLVLQALAVFMKTARLVSLFIVDAIFALVKAFVAGVALFWFLLELCLGLDRSVTEFGHAFTCGIITVIGIAVVCGKTGFGTGWYDIFDPLLEKLDGIVFAVFPGLRRGTGDVEEDGDCLVRYRSPSASFFNNRSFPAIDRSGPDLAARLISQRLLALEADAMQRSVHSEVPLTFPNSHHTTGIHTNSNPVAANVSMLSNDGTRPIMGNMPRYFPVKAESADTAMDTKPSAPPIPDSTSEQSFLQPFPHQSQTPPVLYPPLQIIPPRLCCGGKCESCFPIVKPTSTTRDVSIAVSKSLSNFARDECKSQACVVCKDASKCVIVMPCRHLSCCEDCIQHLLDQDRKCPMCRESIVDFFKVYT